MPLFRNLLHDCAGTIAIEMAFVTPVLALLSLGAFEASTIVARQQELQSGAAEALDIALAKIPKTQEQRDILRNIVAESLKLQRKQVAVTNVFRCELDDNYVNLQSDCSSDEEVSTFLKVEITDTYTPKWTSFGIGYPIDYNVVRMVQIS